MPNKQSLLCLSNNDTLLIGLGEALEALNQDEQQLDRRAIQEPGNAHVIERLTTDLNIRREAIFSAISAVPASSIKGAAIQMRALAWLNSLDTPAAEDERSRLLYSILTVLEKNGGGSRNQWGGNFGLPECCNPFSLSNTDLNSNVALTQRRDADADIVAVGAGKDGDV